MISDQDFTLSSVNGTVRIVAKQAMTFNGGGGAFIQMKDGSITLGGPLDLFIKTITVQKQGKASLNMPLDLTHPALSGLPTRPLASHAHASPASRAAIPAGMPYKLFAGSTLVGQGVLDETGLIQFDHHPTTQQYTLKLASGVNYTIPVAGQYRGNAGNAVRANSGFQFHENGKDPDIAPVIDRAVHRQDYSGLLHAEPGKQTGE